MSVTPSTSSDSTYKEDFPPLSERLHRDQTGASASSSSRNHSTQEVVQKTKEVSAKLSLSECSKTPGIKSEKPKANAAVVKKIDTGAKSLPPLSHEDAKSQINSPRAQLLNQPPGLKIDHPKETPAAVRLQSKFHDLISGIIPQEPDEALTTLIGEGNDQLLLSWMRSRLGQELEEQDPTEAPEVKRNMQRLEGEKRELEEKLKISQETLETEAKKNQETLEALKKSSQEALETEAKKNQETLEALKKSSQETLETQTKTNQVALEALTSQATELKSNLEQSESNLKLTEEKVRKLEEKELQTKEMLIKVDEQVERLRAIEKLEASENPNTLIKDVYESVHGSIGELLSLHGAPRAKSESSSSSSSSSSESEHLTIQTTVQELQGKANALYGNVEVLIRNLETNSSKRNQALLTESLVQLEKLTEEAKKGRVKLSAMLPILQEKISKGHRKDISEQHIETMAKVQAWNTIEKQHKDINAYDQHQEEQIDTLNDILVRFLKIYFSLTKITQDLQTVQKSIQKTSEPFDAQASSSSEMTAQTRLKNISSALELLPKMLSIVTEPAIKVTLAYEIQDYIGGVLETLAQTSRTKRKATPYPPPSEEQQLKKYSDTLNLNRDQEKNDLIEWNKIWNQFQDYVIKTIKVVHANTSPNEPEAPIDESAIEKVATYSGVTAKDIKENEIKPHQLMSYKNKIGYKELLLKYDTLFEHAGLAKFEANFTSDACHRGYYTTKTIYNVNLKTWRASLDDEITKTFVKIDPTGYQIE